MRDGVSITENGNDPEFKDEVAVHGLNNILTVKPDFSGVIRVMKRHLSFQRMNRLY